VSHLSLLDKLPDRSGLDRLWHILPQARLVGGSVRDLLIGRDAVHDLDLATPEPPETVQALFEAAGIKTIPTGLTHGTVTALIDHVPYEITTLRRDVQTNGRHAEVAWTTDWQEDAARRDFTINALFCDRHGDIHDYFGGLEDLAAHHVRFVGDAARRIEEDALRILRFFRFQARFGGTGPQDRPDGEAIRAITSHAALVDRLSAERVASEILRILTGPNLMRSLHLMADTGILPRLLPSADLPRLARALDADVPPDDILRLGLLADTPDLAQRLRLSGKQAQRLARMSPSTPLHGFDAQGYETQNPLILAPSLGDHELRMLLSCHDRQTLTDRSWFAQAERIADVSSKAWNTLRVRIAQLERPVFPLAGRDVMAAGVRPGPAIGETLAHLAAWWRSQGCLPDRMACLAELKTRLPLSSQGAGG